MCRGLVLGFPYFLQIRYTAGIYGRINVFGIFLFVCTVDVVGRGFGGGDLGIAVWDGF